MRSARCCANANSVNASNATKTNPEAMIRVMALPSAHGISCADPHPLFPGGAGEEKREENGEQDDPGRGSQRIIDDGMQRDQDDREPGRNGIGAAIRRQDRKSTRLNSSY